MPDRVITIHHSPDADDAFMFYGFISGVINEPGYTFKLERTDIESLNKKAASESLDVTAVSVHGYAYLANDYDILRCAASFGGIDYGPRLIALNSSAATNDLSGKRIAIPGERTSAALALRLYLSAKNTKAELIPIHFDEIQAAVKQGEVDFGLVIHEGQITHQREGCKTVLDLGAWWWNETGLPLPLGINIAHKRLGKAGAQAAARALEKSIDYALKHRLEAIDYAMSFGRGITTKDADTYIAMYVNSTTQDMGEVGMRSIQHFLRLGYEQGIIPHPVSVGFVDHEE